MKKVVMDIPITVDEFMKIATALKSAKAIVNEETDRDSREEGIDEALDIIDRVINSGIS